MLENRVALVTGAGSGLGRQIALMYAANGAAIGVADIDTAAAQATADKISDAGGRCMVLAMDVSAEQQVDEGTRSLVEQFGRLDILVSNAGVQHISPIVELEFADWRKLIAIHLDGGFLTSRAAMRQMVRQQTGGCILLMGSVHSKVASALKAPYVSAKHGLMGLCRTIAKEGAEHGIRANLICPGYVKTPLVEKQIPEQAQKFDITEEQVIREIMLRDTVDFEFTTLDDIARTALFLAAHPTNALTGQSVIVSHGWYME